MSATTARTRKLEKTAIVDAPQHDLWKAWTTTEGCESFFGREACVELELFGAFEQYFLLDNEPGLRGSEGCTFLSYIPERMLSFSWNAPPQFGELRDEHTFVVVELEPTDDGRTQVRLTHLGWGEGEKWNQVFAYFDDAWDAVMVGLAERFDNSE